jgi:hypothetical protein
MPGLGARLAATMEPGHLSPRGRQACVARSSAAISSAVNATRARRILGRLTGPTAG